MITLVVEIKHKSTSFLGKCLLHTKIDISCRVENFLCFVKHEHKSFILDFNE